MLLSSRLVSLTPPLKTGADPGDLVPADSALIGVMVR